MMIAYVSETEGSQSYKFSVQPGGILPKSSILERYPDCSGLQYRQNSGLKAVYLSNNQFALPSDIKLSTTTFHCVHRSGNNRDLTDKTMDDSANLSIWEHYELSTFDMRVVNLLNDTTNETFFNYFQKFGKLSLCELKTDTVSKKCKGFGFIRYANINDHANCVKSNHEVNGKEVTLRLSTNKIDADKNRRMIFLSRITPSITEEDILKHFSVFGKITEFFMPLVKIRFAILTFESDYSVQRIFQHGQSHRVFGGFIFIDYIHKNKSTKPPPDQSTFSNTTFQSIIKQPTEQNQILPSSSSSCFSSSSSPSSDPLNYNTNNNPYFYPPYLNTDFNPYCLTNSPNSSIASYQYYNHSQYYTYGNINSAGSSTNPYFSPVSTQDSYGYPGYNGLVNNAEQNMPIDSYQYNMNQSYEYPTFSYPPNKPQNIDKSLGKVKPSNRHSNKTSRNTSTDINLTEKTQKALNMLRNPEVLDTIIHLSKILSGDTGE